MKKVTFNTAKALKNAGYPQGWKCDEHYCLESEGEYGYQIGDIISANVVHKNCLEAISAPAYIDVWLWLWKEKNIRFDIEDLWDAELSYPERGCASNTNQLGGICTPEVSDPEEAIEKAIDFLVENKLLK